MAANSYTYTGQNSLSHRAVAMGLALVSAIVLSPLYVTRKDEHHHHTIFYNETRYWNSSFVLPIVIAILIIAIKTTSSSIERGARVSVFPSPDPSWVLRIGSSSWGLAGILFMLMLVLSWQDSVQHFFWR